MLKALITDTHFGVRNDNPLFYEYFDKFLDEVFFPTIKKKGIKKIIHLGDVNERRKYMNYQTLVWANTFFKRCYDLGLEIDIIAGNHDTYYKSTNSVNSPDLLFSKYDNVKVYSEAEDVDGVLYVPWINSENKDKTLQAIINSESEIVMGHLELTGYTMFKGIVCQGGTNPDIFHKFKSVYTGHFHTKSSSRNVHYLGCPWDLMFTDADEVKGFHLWESSDNSISFIENPYKMYWKLYYDDASVENLEDMLLSKSGYAKIKNTYVKVFIKSKTNPIFYDRYIKCLNDANPTSLIVVEDYLTGSNIMGEEEKSSLMEDTLSLLVNSLNDYSDIIGTDEKKQSVEKILSDLYIKALKA